MKFLIFHRPIILAAIVCFPLFLGGNYTMYLVKGIR